MVFCIRHWPLFPILIVVIVFGYIPGPWCLRFGKISGPIQVVGNDKDLWIFLQVDWVVTGPPPYSAAHEQYVFHFDGNEWSPAIEIPSRKGLNFHKNNTSIVWLDEKLYGFRADQKGSIYAWDGYMFHRLDDSESQLLKTAHGFASDMSFAQYWAHIDVTVRQQGSEILYRGDLTPYNVKTDNSWHSETHFSWKDRAFALVGKVQDNIQTVSIVEFPERNEVSLELVSVSRGNRYISYAELFLLRTLK